MYVKFYQKLKSSFAGMGAENFPCKQPLRQYTYTLQNNILLYNNIAKNLVEKIHKTMNSWGHQPPGIHLSHNLHHVKRLPRNV